MCINFQKYNSSFAPASQQIIKRLNQRVERTNTRFKHQSEQFWVAEKNTKGGGTLKRPAPLCVFLGSQNSSNCCLSLVFVGFNLLILCWLAGANDEVHSFKFNPYYLTFETLGIMSTKIHPVKIDSVFIINCNNAVSRLKNYPPPLKSEPIKKILNDFFF